MEWQQELRAFHDLVARFYDLLQLQEKPWVGDFLASEYAKMAATFPSDAGFAPLLARSNYHAREQLRQDAQTGYNALLQQQQQQLLVQQSLVQQRHHQTLDLKELDRRHQQALLQQQLLRQQQRQMAELQEAKRQQQQQQLWTQRHQMLVLEEGKRQQQQLLMQQQLLVQQQQQQKKKPILVLDLCAERAPITDAKQKRRDQMREHERMVRQHQEETELQSARERVEQAPAPPPTKKRQRPAVPWVEAIVLQPRHTKVRCLEPPTPMTPVTPMTFDDVDAL